MNEGKIMNEISDEVYRELQKALDKLPVGYPKTESGVEIRILKKIFTPEQAFIGSKLGFELKPLYEIYKSIEKGTFTLAKVEEILDEMHKLGLILKAVRDGIKYYAASPFMLGFYEFQMNKMTEDFIHDVDQYIDEAFLDELNSTKIPQLRTIPIEKEIRVEGNITNYDNVRYYLENCREPIVLNECICRKKNDIIGKSCQTTNLRESCFSFGSAGKAYLDRGLGRVITKEEALEIIEQAERDGLVLQIGNSQRPMSLCTCCGCCCNLLANEKKLDAPAQFLGSNFFAQVDEELCSGCGTCETRCPMDAVEIIDSVSNINLKRCIGCGVCVSTCPEEAITLIEKEEKDKTIPPKNTLELYLNIAKKKAELSKQE